MSGFIATGETEPFVITNDWFPDIDAEHLRSSMRLDGSVSDPRLETAIISAILSSNRELASLQAANADYDSLADVPAVKINGESRLVALYRRAIYTAVAAELYERHRGHDSSGDGFDRAQVTEPAIDELRRDTRWAISDLLGIPRNTVELI